jgi:uncharacterized Ntn-hydrolase superfamily protein
MGKVTATQPWINTTYGSRGLESLERGLSVTETIALLTGEDKGRAHRQVGMIDVRGEAASYTGEACPPWAGGLVGTHYACQGNFLASDAPILAIAEAFEEAQGPLWDRLLAALVAGQQAGGDRRGQQAAALLVVQAGAGFRGFNDRVIDLRVDDHPTPIVELRRILQVRLADPAWSARG